MVLLSLPPPATARVTIPEVPGPAHESWRPYPRVMMSHGGPTHGSRWVMVDPCPPTPHRPNPARLTVPEVRVLPFRPHPVRRPLEQHLECEEAEEHVLARLEAACQRGVVKVGLVALHSQGDAVEQDDDQHEVVKHVVRHDTDREAPHGVGLAKEVEGGGDQTLGNLLRACSRAGGREGGRVEGSGFRDGDQAQALSNVEDTYHQVTSLTMMY